MPLVLYRCLKNKPAAGPRLRRLYGASSLRTCCLCPLAASTARRGLPVSLEAIAAPGGRMAAPGHAGPLHPWLVWFPSAGRFLALPPAEDGTGRAWVALQHILLWGPSLVLLIWETHMAAQPGLLPISLPRAGQSPQPPCDVPCPGCWWGRVVLQGPDAPRCGAAGGTGEAGAHGAAGVE